MQGVDGVEVIVPLVVNNWVQGGCKQVWPGFQEAVHLNGMID